MWWDLAFLKAASDVAERSKKFQECAGSQGTGRSIWKVSKLIGSSSSSENEVQGRPGKASEGTEQRGLLTLSYACRTLDTREGK